MDIHLREGVGHLWLLDPIERFVEDVHPSPIALRARMRRRCRCCGACGVCLMPRVAFPPVTTAEWDAAIQHDLKGADYQKTLVWQLDEGIAVKPYYRRDDIAGLAGGTPPGVFPFERGTGLPWQPLDPASLPQDAIRADALHDAGAHAVQELAFAMAAGVDRLDSATRAGTPVLEAAAGVGVRLRGGIDLLRRNREAARRPRALGTGHGGVWRRRRSTGRDAASRAHGTRKQEHVRSVHEPAPLHDRGDVCRDWRSRHGLGRTGRIRRAPGRQRAAHPRRGVAPGGGHRPGGRLVLRRGADRHAGARSVARCSSGSSARVATRPPSRAAWSQRR